LEIDSELVVRGSTRAVAGKVASSPDIILDMKPDISPDMNPDVNPDMNPGTHRKQSVGEEMS
ncbi:MAG: hypothetical protein VXB94_13565, partial [Rhodobiaceae bacterium]